MAWLEEGGPSEEGTDRTGAQGQGSIQGQVTGPSSGEGAGEPRGFHAL